MDVFKELLSALIPLIKQSPLYLVSVIVMTIEGLNLALGRAQTGSVFPPH